VSNLEDPDLRQTNTEFLWTKNVETTKIAIDSSTVWEPALTEHRPALIVKRNDWQHRRISIDNRVHGSSRADGAAEYTNLWLGSHTVFALSGEGAECEKLAAETYRELNQFAGKMRKALNLMRLEMVSIGALAKLEEASENFAVPLNIGYAFSESWIVHPNAPPLRSGSIGLS
jgi:hypothetical protein